MHMRESRINPILLLVGIILSTLILNVVSLGEPFSTLPSEFEETEKEHDVPVSTNAHWGPSYKRPYPTNAWFQNVVLPGFGPLTTYPYIQWISTEQKYFGLCYPNRVVSNMYVMSGYMNNLMVSANEALGDRQLVGHDDLSALVQFASVADATKKIVSPIVRGQAYNTFEFTGLTPKITTIQMYTSINGLTGQTTVTADKLKITMNNGQTWLIYSTSPITWNVGQSALVASAPFTGVIRIAHLLDPSYETVFDRYRATYPYSGSVSYSVASGTPNDIATLTFRFTKKGGNDPLLLFTLPHHRDTLTNANYVTPTVTYRSIKGDVILNIGDTWTLREPLVNDIGFYARYTINEKDRETLRAALIADQNSLPGPKDPYFGGKAVARLGRLAVIADELGETAIAAKIRSNMKAYLNKWFNVGFTTRDNKLIYEKTYGGIVSKNSISCSACDFGQYYYNDHHFHYGYFVYAAAVVIKKDQAWGATYKNKILELARDYGNPSNNDPYYAKLRNKDWFVGHSFAAGLYAFADSRNQESTSESINAYYGLYLLGLVYNDQNMKDIGRITLATEIRSAQKYWQINSTSTIYEPVYSANRCVGVLWETKVDYATFFGLNVEYIHGIQMLPYTPITIDYITPDWIKDSYPVFSAAYTRADPVASDAWKGLLYQAQAVIDLPTATSLINTLKGYDDGNTRTNTLYWLYTIPSSYNQKRTNVFADIDPVGSTPSPAPSPTPTPSPSPTPTPAPTPPTPTPSPNPSPSPTPNPPSSGCTISCGPNTEVCGGACISSDKFSCCSGTAVTKGTTCGGTGVVDPACTNVKCAAGYNCCGGACYNPSIFSCFDGMLCAVGYNRCGKACYDPKIFSCCSGALRAGSC